MDAIREQLENPIIAGVTGFVVGLIIGLVVLGWGLFPVEWTDADPSYLRQDLKGDYLRMVIDSYAANQDAELAIERWKGLGDGANELLAAIEINPATQDINSIAAFRSLITDLPAGEVEKPASNLLGLLLLFVLLVGLAFGGVYLLRQRTATGEAGPMTAAEQAELASRDVARTDYSEDPPIGQFMTTYMLGDDLFDDSFSIDSPSGEFLGECGAGISETIGVGDPKRVTAFEVWLFDKNDIQTVTRVLMSDHAYEDDEMRTRLSTKGAPVVAEPGQPVVLETATLKLVARVVDMSYGEGPLPPDSYFDRMTLELAVWPKAS